MRNYSINTILQELTKELTTKISKLEEEVETTDLIVTGHNGHNSRLEKHNNRLKKLEKKIEKLEDKKFYHQNGGKEARKTTNNTNRSRTRKFRKVKNKN